MSSNTVDTVVSNINIWEGTSAQIQSAISGGDMSENDVAFVTDIDFEDKFRFATMPSISSSTPELLGKIVQYIGPTTETYTNGYFYIGEPDSVQYSAYSSNSNLTVTVIDEAKLLRFLKLWGRNGSNSQSFIYYYNTSSSSYYWIREPNTGSSSDLSFYGLSYSGTPEVNDQIIINFAFSSYHWTQCDVQPTVNINNVQEKIQYSEMPTASEDYVTKVIQYVGNTTETYTQGCFYVCVSDGAATPTYSWNLIDQVPDNAILNVGTGVNTLVNQYAGSGSDVATLISGTGNTVVGYSNVKTSTASDLNSVTIFGSGNEANTNSTTFGKGNFSSQSSVIIGEGNTGNSVGSIVIGRGSEVTQGNNAGGIAIGQGAKIIVTGAASIQLGTGTNAMAGSFQVFNYRVLDTSGYIPRNRLASNMPSNNWVLAWDSATNTMKWKTMNDAINTKEDLFRYSMMPDISYDPQTYEGTIIQYLGNTTSQYTQGYFYKGISNYSSFDAYIDDWISGGSTPTVVFDREKFINKVHPTSEQTLFRFLYDHGWDLYDEDSGTSIENVNIADYGISFNPAQSSFTTDDCVAVEHTVQDYGWERINVQPGTQITVDDTMSDVSTNPVQNAVITTAVNNKQDVFQYSVMPTASESLEGKIIQYVGASIQDSYQNGYFYRCIYDEDDDVYMWEDVGFAGGGGGEGQLPDYTTTFAIKLESKTSANTASAVIDNRNGITINSGNKPIEIEASNSIDILSNNGSDVTISFNNSSNVSHYSCFSSDSFSDHSSYTDTVNDTEVTKTFNTSYDDFEVAIRKYDTSSENSKVQTNYTNLYADDNGGKFEYQISNGSASSSASIELTSQDEGGGVYTPIVTATSPTGLSTNEVATTGYVQESLGNLKFWHGTEQDYDNISTYDPNTLYIIIPYGEF